MILRIGSGRPMLLSVYAIFVWPWTWPSLKKHFAIAVGYCARARQCAARRAGGAAARAHRHLRVVAVLVRGDADRGLQRAREVALVRVELHELEPRRARVARRVQAALERLLRLLLVVQAEPELGEDLPLEPRLPVRDVLRLEVRDLRAEDRPHAQVLRARQHRGGRGGGRVRTS
jgi:hypothetical protein